MVNYVWFFPKQICFCSGQEPIFAHLPGPCRTWSWGSRPIICSCYLTAAGQALHISTGRQVNFMFGRSCSAKWLSMYIIPLESVRNGFISPEDIRNQSKLYFWRHPRWMSSLTLKVCNPKTLWSRTSFWPCQMTNRLAGYTQSFTFFARDGLRAISSSSKTIKNRTEFMG